jgi:ABC-2 type transport system ATP-binding protein
MTEKAIRIDKLTRTFGSIKALDDLSLDISTGSIFSFLGPNGAGKTTTINILLGLLEPTTGKAEVLGFDTRTHAADIRTRAGALLEHTGLYEQMSAEDNLQFYARVWRLTDAERQARIKELLTQMGLWERRNERVVKWSKGMKQKLAIARVLIHRPPLLFLDEPTAGLDVMAATAIHDDLAALANRERVTVFMTTHNMAEAEKLCSQVAVIRQGKLLAVGTPDELRAHTSHPQVEIIGAGFNEHIVDLLKARAEVSTVELHNNHLSIQLHQTVDVAPLVSLMVSEGVLVEEVRKGKANLEEVFLTLMEEENVG